MQPLTLPHWDFMQKFRIKTGLISAISLAGYGALPPVRYQYRPFSPANIIYHDHLEDITAVLPMGDNVARTCPPIAGLSWIVDQIGG